MSMSLSVVRKHVGVGFFHVSPQRLCVYVVVCINLYNFEFIQAFINACAQLICFHGIVNSTPIGMHV